MPEANLVSQKLIVRLTSRSSWQQLWAMHRWRLMPEAIVGPWDADGQAHFQGQLAVSAGQAQMEAETRGYCGPMDADGQAHFLGQVEADARGHCGPMDVGGQAHYKGSWQWQQARHRRRLMPGAIVG